MRSLSAAMRQRRQTRAAPPPQGNAEPVGAMLAAASEFGDNILRLFQTGGSAQPSALILQRTPSLPNWWIFSTQYRANAPRLLPPPPETKPEGKRDSKEARSVKAPGGLAESDGPGSVSESKTDSGLLFFGARFGELHKAAADWTTERSAAIASVTSKLPFTPGGPVAVDAADAEASAAGAEASGGPLQALRSALLDPLQHAAAAAGKSVAAGLSMGPAPSADAATPAEGQDPGAHTDQPTGDEACETPLAVVPSRGILRPGQRTGDPGVLQARVKLPQASPPAAAKGRKAGRSRRPLSQPAPSAPVPSAPEYVPPAGAKI
jgi:hypothetical protein